MTNSTFAVTFSHYIARNEQGTDATYWLREKLTQSTVKRSDIQLATGATNADGGVFKAASSGRFREPLHSSRPALTFTSVVAL